MLNDARLAAVVVGERQAVGDAGYAEVLNFADVEWGDAFHVRVGASVGFGKDGRLIRGSLVDQGDGRDGGGKNGGDAERDLDGRERAHQRHSFQNEFGAARGAGV